MTITERFISVKNKGFALPTILIVSVVMLSVLLFSVASTSSVSSALKTQYYNQAAQYASDSGIAFANSCLTANNNVATWSDASPLKANTDCYGLNQNGITCADNSIDPRCNVTLSADSKIATTFSIGAPKTKVNGWRQIASSNNHTCAISYDYRAYCWGYNGNGQLGIGNITDSNVPVRVIDTGVMTGKNIKSIAVGSSHTCAITFDGQLYCWGANTSGQLGNTSNTDSSVPVSPTNTALPLLGKTIISVAAGISHTCVLASDGLVSCWGSGTYGQLGDNTLVTKNYPVAVNMVNGTSALYGKTVLSIAVGGYHTCVIASDSLVYCWGYNVNGQVGFNDTNNKQVPVAVNMVSGTSALYGKTVRKITANGVSEAGATIGYGHTCVIASDSLPYCWGYNAKGQIGNNAVANRLAPTAVNVAGVLASKTVLSIAANSQSTCVIASDSKPYCWGYNNVSQLGNGNTTDSLVPIQSTSAVPSDGSTAISVSSGSYNSCLIASNYQSYCWGLNTNGQIGDGSNVNKSTATLVSTTNIIGAPAATISVTGTTKLINANGNVWRRYTNNKNVDISTKNWSKFAAGTSHNCAVDTDGQAYCWGLNTNGQLGDNSTTQRNTPTAVNTASGTSALYGKTIKAITAGASHTCAIASDNLPYCWGLNTSGQLGDGGTTQRPAAVAVTTGALAGKTVIDIAAGGNHTCALASNNLVYCWGLNANGQIGDNTSGTNRTAPTAVNTAASSLLNKTVISITAGANHTCAVASDSTANCWGLNTNGQLGDNSVTQRLLPVLVNTAASSLLNKKVASISAGTSHTCAIATDSTAHCWGLNTNGQLGDNSVTQRLLPVLVNTTVNVSDLNTKTAVGISAGTAHTCVIASDGGVYCWGLNTSGQLGNRTLVQSQVPLTVYRAGFMENNYAAEIYVKDNGSCVISVSGNSLCWGRGTGGQIGNNDILDSNEPLLTTMPNRASINL